MISQIEALINASRQPEAKNNVQNIPFDVLAKVGGFWCIVDQARGDCQVRNGQYSYPSDRDIGRYPGYSGQPGKLGAC
jgi:hypothetical protein